MKINRTILVLFNLLSLSVQALTMKDVLLSMPTDLLPTLPLSARQDLVDFYTNNRTAAMPAAFNNQMILKVFTEDYLLLQTSPVSTLQVKRLSVDDTMTVLALIHTTQGPLEDSRLVFFSPDWKPIPQGGQPLLKPSSFLRTQDEALARRFDADCARLFVRMAWSPASTDLITTHSLKVDVPSEKLLPYQGLLADTLRLVWSGKGYIPAFSNAPVTGQTSTVLVK